MVTVHDDLAVELQVLCGHPALVKRLQGQPTFFQILGAYYQRTAQSKKAMEAFEKGLALDPGSTPLRQGLMWLLIDTQNAAALKLLLAAAEPVWARDADMHGALAAAYMTLSRPAVALERYLKPHRAEHAAHHATVHGTDHRMIDCRVAERAVRVHDAQLVVAVVGTVLLTRKVKPSSKESQ